MAEAKITHITDDITFRGEINFEEKLVIDGKVEGRIKSPGKIEIMPGASVKADIEIKNINVNGSLQGNINASDAVHLSGTAQVKGDISCKSLQIDKGARHNGTTEMG